MYTRKDKKITRIKQCDENNCFNCEYQKSSRTKSEAAKQWS